MRGWIINFLLSHFPELVLSFLIALLGVRWVQLKRLIAEVTDLLVSVNTAIADDKLSKAELQKVLAELRQVIEAAKGLLQPVRASWI